MHKVFLFFLGFLIATNLKAQQDSQRFAEVNLGFAAIDTHIFSSQTRFPEEA
jgi:Skp family chaperone for outer membrane proteins